MMNNDIHSKRVNTVLGLALSWRLEKQSTYCSVCSRWLAWDFSVFHRSNYKPRGILWTTEKAQMSDQEQKLRHVDKRSPAFPQQRRPHTAAARMVWTTTRILMNFIWTGVERSFYCKLKWDYTSDQLLCDCGVYTTKSLTGSALSPSGWRAFGSQKAKLSKQIPPKEKKIIDCVVHVSFLKCS